MAIEFGTDILNVNNDLHLLKKYNPVYVDKGLISFTKGMQPIVAVSQGTAGNCDWANIDSVPLATSGETSVAKPYP